MDTIGKLLREQREDRNLTLDNAADATKIRKIYLKAMEEDDFKALPGDVFAKGMLRTYGNYLGLDGKKLVEEYKKINMGIPEEEAVAESIREADAKKVKVVPGFKSNVDIGAGGKEHTKKYMVYFIGAVIVLLLATAVYYLFLHKDTDKADMAATSQNSAVQVEDKAEKFKPDTVVLKVKASGDCWMEVKNARGKILYSGIMHKNDSKKFEDKQKISVIYGARQNVSVNVNNREEPVPGAGKVVKTYTTQGKDKK